MDRDELLALDKEVLVDLILRLHERVAALEAGVGRPPKGPGNSSIPPSAGYKPNRAERRKKKRGPKKGHQGLSRRRAAPDVVVRCRPAACRGCGAALAEAGQRRVRRSQVVELPELRPVVIEAWVYAARCASCGERTVGDTTPRCRPGYLSSYPGPIGLTGCCKTRLGHIASARRFRGGTSLFGYVQGFATTCKS